MNWLISQLFGAQAAAHLTDKVSAVVAAYLLSQPAATIEQIEALVVSRADSLISSVAGFFPSWARPLLIPILDSTVSSLVNSAYQALTKQASPATGSA